MTWENHGSLIIGEHGTVCAMPSSVAGLTASDPNEDVNAQLIAAAPDLLAALKNVRALIAEGAMTGFNPLDGSWAGRLFESQQQTSAAVAKAEGKSDD